MKQLRLIGIVVLALVTTVLDTSFFSFIDFRGSTLISSFALAVVLALLGSNKNLSIYSLSLLVFFAALSSLPLAVIVVCFFLIPSLLSFFAHRYLPEFRLPIVLGIYLLACLLFNLVLFVDARDWSSDALALLGWATLGNALCGFFLFLAAQQIKKRFSAGVIRLQ